MGSLSRINSGANAALALNQEVTDHVIFRSPQPVFPAIDHDAYLVEMPAALARGRHAQRLRAIIHSKLRGHRRSVLFAISMLRSAGRSSTSEAESLTQTQNPTTCRITTGGKRFRLKNIRANR